MRVLQNQISAPLTVSSRRFDRKYHCLKAITNAGFRYYCNDGDPPKQVSFEVDVAGVAEVELVAIPDKSVGDRGGVELKRRSDRHGVVVARVISPA